MAERAPRVVAELGRPETPEETAARKAEFSRTYRGSQNTRNLIAALIATVAIVIVIVFAVPRGTPPEREPIDVAAVARSVSTAQQSTAIAPEVSDFWTVNSALSDVESSVQTWTIVYAPSDEDVRGFLRVSQGFSADPAWYSRVLPGATPDGTLSTGGVEWERFSLDPTRAGNLTVALVTTAGADTILVYGIADDDTLDDIASAVSPEVLALREESE